MNKKANTLLFILGATLFNMLVTVISFIVLLLIYARAIMPLIPEGGQAWGFTVIFIAAIVLAFVIYRGAINLLTKKVDVEKYFDPIFGRKKK
jgi:membrane protein implicated in regulation of membrane protease activity